MEQQTSTDGSTLTSNTILSQCVESSQRKYKFHLILAGTVSVHISDHQFEASLRKITAGVCAQKGKYKLIKFCCPILINS